MALSIADRERIPAALLATLAGSGELPPPEPSGAATPKNSASFRLLGSGTRYVAPNTGLRNPAAPSTLGGEFDTMPRRTMGARLSVNL